MYNVTEWSLMAGGFLKITLGNSLAPHVATGLPHPPKEQKKKHNALFFFSFLGGGAPDPAPELQIQPWTSRSSPGAPK